MSTINDVIREVQKVVSTIPGMTRAPLFPPEKISMYPCSVAFEGAGTWQPDTAGGTYGSKRGRVTVIVQVYIARNDLEKSAKQASFFSDQVPNAIYRSFYSDQFNNTVDGIGEILTSGLIAMSYAVPNEEKNMLGYEFHVKDIQIRSINS